MVGVILYIIAAILSWLIHPGVAIVIFIFVVAYYAWTSQGLRFAHRGTNDAGTISS